MLLKKFQFSEKISGGGGGVIGGGQGGGLFKICQLFFSLKLIAYTFTTTKFNIFQFLSLAKLFLNLIKC